MAKSIAKKKREAELKKFAEPERFPRHLYKKGGKLEWGHKIKYSQVLVTSEEEFEIAVKEGYTDDFNEALFGEEKSEPKKEEKKADDMDDF